MSDWRGGVNEEGEPPLHIHTRWGESLNIGAECWRLGILASMGMGMGMGMGISEATCNRHGSKRAGLGSLGSLGDAGAKAW